MPIFESNGKRYNVRDEHISSFMGEMPDATTIIDHDGKQYRVKAKDYNTFYEEVGGNQVEQPQTEQPQGGYNYQARTKGYKDAYNNQEVQNLIDKHLGVRPERVQPSLQSIVDTPINDGSNKQRINLDAAPQMADLSARNESVKPTTPIQRTKMEIEVPEETASLQEMQQVDNIYTPKAVENEGDILTNNMNRFKLTERGAELDNQRAVKEGEIVDKYWDIFKQSEDYKKVASGQYKTQAEVDEANKLLNDLFIRNYGNAIDKELEPYNNAMYQEMMKRYGTRVNNELTELNKQRNANNVKSLAQGVEESIEKVQNRIKEKSSPITEAYLGSHGIVSHKADRQELSMLNQAKELLNDSQNLIDEANRKGNTNVLASFGRGFWDNLNAKDFTFGLADMADMGNLYTALDKAEKGEKISDGEEKLIEASYIHMLTQAYTDGDIGIGYNTLGAVTAESVPFILEFVFNPIAASGNVLAKRLLTQAVKKYGMKRAAKQAAKFGTRLLTDATAATGMTLTSSLPRVFAGAEEELIKNNYNYGIDENGELKVEKVGDMTYGQALGKSAAKQFIEHQSEMVFNALKGWSPIMKAASTTTPNGMNGVMDMIRNSRAGELYRQWAKNPIMKEAAERAQFHGIFEEWGEELYANFANIPLGEMTIDEALDFENNLETFLGLAPTSIVFGMLGLGGMYRDYRKMNKAVSLMSEEQQEMFNELKAMSRTYGKDALRDRLKSVLLNPNLAQEQKRDFIEMTYYAQMANATEEVSEEIANEKVAAENEAIDNATDPKTGLYGEVTRIVRDDNGEEVEVSCNVYDEKIVNGETYLLVAEEGSQEKEWIKPSQYISDSYHRMPAEEVKSQTEQIIREDAEKEVNDKLTYSEDVLAIPYGSQFQVGEITYVPIQQYPNGFTIYQAIDAEGNEVGAPNAAIGEKEMRDMMQEAKDAAEQQAERSAERAKSEPIIQLKSGQYIMATQMGKDNVHVIEVDEQGNPVSNPEIDENVDYKTYDAWKKAHEEKQQAQQANNMSAESAQNEVAPTEESEQNVSEEVQQGEELADESASEAVASPSQPTIPTEGEEVLYHKVPVDVTLADLNDGTLDEVEQDEFIAAKKAEAAKMLDNLNKKKPKVGTNKAKYLAEKQVWEQKVAEAQSRADYWNNVEKAMRDSRVKVGDAVAEEVMQLDQAMNGAELAAQMLAQGRLPLLQSSYKEETGYGQGETQGMFGLFRSAENGGMTIDHAAELLALADEEEHNGHFFGGDSEVARNTLLQVLSEVQTRGGLNNYISNIREQQAKAEQAAEYEAYEQGIQAMYGVSVGEYEAAYNDYLNNNPYDGVDVNEIDAIFADAASEYEQYLNNIDNGQRTITEGTEGSNDVLPEEQPDNEGRVEESKFRGQAEGDVSSSNDTNEVAQGKEQQVAKPRKRPIGFGKKKSTQERFEEEKAKFANSLQNEYGEVLRESSSVEEAIDKLQEKADQARAEAKDWANRKYKDNKSVVTGTNATSAADEYETTIGAANERRRQANISRLLNKAKEYEEWIRILSERTGFTPTESRKRVAEEEDILAMAERIANEEKRRKPLRKRARELERTLGVKVNLIERIEDVPNRAARAAIEQGQNVTGWYEQSTGEVCFYMPNLANESEVDATYIHEVVAHKGLRGMLGDKFDAFCDDVWDMMSDADKAKFINYPGVNGDTRAAADEYIAHLAENVDVTESAWSKFTELLKKFLKAIGIEPKMTDADIANAIKQSYQRLLSGEQGENVGEGTRFMVKKRKEQLKKAERFIEESLKGNRKNKTFTIELPERVINNIKSVLGDVFDSHNLSANSFVHARNKHGVNGTEIDEKSIPLRTEDFKLAPYIMMSPDRVERGSNSSDIRQSIKFTKLLSNGKAVVVEKEQKNSPDDMETITMWADLSSNVVDARLKRPRGTTSETVIISMDDAAKIRKDAENAIEEDENRKEKTRFRTTYHGSGAEFDRFDHSFMGTGEGSQAYGFGTYVSDVEGIARNYGDIALHGRNKFKYVGSKDVNKWVLADAEQILDRAGSYEEAMKRYGNATLAPGTALEEAVTFLKSTSKEDWEGQRHLYNVDIPDDNGLNYLSWNDEVQKEKRREIVEDIYDEILYMDVDGAYKNEIDRIELKSDLWRATQRGGDIYGWAKSLGGDRAASEFFSEHGYVGIKVPTNNLRNGDKNHWNYVIFNEHDLDIVEHTRFRAVTDPLKIAELEAGKKVKVYRAMQLVDGKLYPPMSAKVNGKMRDAIELGRWEEAEERPEMADDKGYFKLDKGNGKSLKARYNPYIHTSTTPLNDQFSSAQDRPELVTVEVEIPESELTSGYKADKAKDAVGKLEWKAGVVQGKLSGTRTVILSRWDKPIRIVPDSEVADEIVKMFGDKQITMPSNVVTPSLRAELEKRGVPFVETDNQGKEVGGTRFKVKDRNELVAVHNISEGNLRKVLNVGGLIMPSIAITKYDMGHEGYGDISLLFDKETINPSDRRNKVYGGDAWTPRFPQIVPKISEKVRSNIKKKVYELIEDRNLRENYSLSAELHPDNIERTITNRGIEGYYNEEWMKLAYLLDNGKKVKIPMKMKDYGDMSETIIAMAKDRGLKVSDIQQSSFDFYNNNKDFVEAIKNIVDERKLSSLPEDKRDVARKLFGEKEMRFVYFDTLISAARGMEYDLEHGGLREILDRAALRETIEKKVKTNNADYNKWVDNLFDGIVEKYGIRNNRDWYTPSGDSRRWEQLYDAATPSNILKRMLAENEQGGSGGFWDSNIMGASAESYDSIEEIREKGKKRLKRLTEEEYDAWSNSIANRMSDICYEFLSPSQREEFGASVDAKIEITNAVAKNKSANGIYKYMKARYPKFTMEHANRVEAIVKEIQDFAIGYFEAKPQRIVPLSEVRKAIVPSGTSSDILDGLRDNGIDVVTYKKGNENARARLIKKESEGIRFRVSEPALDYAEEEDVVDVQSGDVVYTLNNVDNQLYKTSGKYMRRLYKNGEIGRVLKGEYAEIDQIKAREEYNHAKPILEEYLSELEDMKSKSSNAAQRIIDGVISDIEYALDYYKNLSLGKDVWRTDAAPRFRVSDAPFYSNAERAVEGIKQEKATPQQWLAMIEKNGGLKAGEDKWLGLSDWLKGQDAKSLTKQEVLDYINANQIQIEEVHYGGGEWEAKLDAFNEEFRELIDEGEEATGSIYTSDWVDYAYEAMVDRYGDDFRDAFEVAGQGTAASLEATYDWNNNLSGAAQYYLGVENPINSTREEYTTKGLENKREIALVVPTIESWNENDEVHFGDAGDGRAVAWVRFGETRGEVAEKESVDKFLADMRSKYNAVEGEETDYMNKDEIKHLQSLTSNEIDARENAPRILVIDEIQSKRHQEAREVVDKNTKKRRGYEPIEVANYRKADNALNSFKREMQKKYGFDWSSASKEEISQINKLEEDYSKADEALHQKRIEMDKEGVKMSDIPSAPFETNWHELAMKRMLRYAAENGYDKVAWTKGAQQAERYDLSEQISGIEVRRDNKMNEGGYDVYTYDTKGKLIPQASGEMTTEQITETFGKDLGSRIIAVEKGKKETLSGDNLKIGGEGMKGFYDEILPRFMNKYGKKWGVKVGEVELPNLEESARKMWSVDVTDAMKDSVMEGQPMFRISNGGLTNDQVRALEFVTGKSREEVVRDYGKPKNRISKKDAIEARNEMSKFIPRAKNTLFYNSVADLLNPLSGISALDKAYIIYTKLKGIQFRGFYNGHNKNVVLLTEYILNKDRAKGVIVHEYTHLVVNKLLKDGVISESELDDVLAFCKRRYPDIYRKATIGYKESAHAQECISYLNEHFYGMLGDKFFEDATFAGKSKHDKLFSIILNELKNEEGTNGNNPNNGRKGWSNLSHRRGSLYGRDDERGGRERRVQATEQGRASGNSEGVRFRVSDTDSQGRKLSEGQKEFFANSKALDSNGNLLVLYHGTNKAGFTEFKSGWFTTSKKDAISYSGDREGRMFDPNEKQEQKLLSAGDYRLGYMTFDTEEDRANFLKKHPTAKDAITEREYDSMLMQVETDEEQNALEERRFELEKIWDDYRKYEFSHLTKNTIGEILANQDAYTENDFRRAILAYDSNAYFDDIDDIEDAEERREALVDALNQFNEDTIEDSGVGIGDIIVATRVPRNGEGVKHNDYNRRTYEVYVNVTNPYIMDAEGRHSELESGDVYKAVKSVMSNDKYDGIIIRNWRVGRYQELGDVVVPKSGNQVKLVSNDNPTNASDIRFRTSDAEYAKAVEDGDTKKVLKLVKDAAKDAMPNTKVVDRWGNPRIVYHGTASEEKFNIFDKDASNEMYFFTSSESNADSYTHKRGVFADPIQSGRIIPAFLNLENPLIIDANKRLWRNISVEWSEEPVSTEDIAKYAKEQGYDGVIILKVRDNMWDDIKSYADVFIAFSPNQIKNVGASYERTKRWHFPWDEYDQMKVTGATYDDNGNLIPLSERFDSGKDDIRFRVGNSGIFDDAGNEVALVEREVGAARDQYERTLRTATYQFQEAMQDSMLALKVLQKSIAKATNSRILDFENAWMAENALSSMSLAEMDAYRELLFKPLLQEIANLEKEGLKYDEISDYLITKHGIERNREMAVREALKQDANTYKQNLERWNAEKQAVWADDTKTWEEQQAELDRIAVTYGADLSNDYSGLSAMYGDKWSKPAYDAVKSFEAAHDTKPLYDALGAATGATIDKPYESGLMSKESHEGVKQMFQFYVPLRGWEEETSADVYEYLTTEAPAFNAPLKKMNGRKSKADDPIATLANVAESAILQGNRNKMKQKFLNMVMNHKSDAVSVSNLWLSYDDVTKEWKAIYPEFSKNASAEEVERITAEFNEKMEQLSQAEPNKYKKASDANDIPYKTMADILNEHQVIVKRNGKTYVLTINGNPRAAQALNGLTNPDNDANGAIGAILKSGEWLNRQLSAFYTTRNPNFMASNFLRDAIYSNTMAWVKESPAYAWNFNVNFAKVNPKKLHSLIRKYRNGKLDMSNPMEKAFSEFIKNGGETGYTNLRDVEKQKKVVKRELKKAKKMNLTQALDMLAERFDDLNRSIENCARFAAFLTSRQQGRSIERSVFDAKEISVNFNKKGAGAKFMGTTGETKVGNVASFISGLGRAGFVFWNAGVQGLYNFGKAAANNPIKFTTACATFYLLGALMPMLADADDDDDDELDNYENLPDYVRRTNICFRNGFGDWVTIPLPIELRALYGLGEMSSMVLSGKEKVDALKIAEQLSQVMPIDMLEGEGGLKAFVPSSVKPVVEAYVWNKDWTGLPIYKDTPFNKEMPEWTKVYKNADPMLVKLSQWSNEFTRGKNDLTGWANWNPAKVEHLLEGYFGGVATTIEQMSKSAQTIAGTMEFDWRNIPIGSRVIKSGNPRVREQRINNEYFDNIDRMEELRLLRKQFESNAQTDDLLERAKWIDEVRRLDNDEEYKNYQTFKKMNTRLKKLEDKYKETQDENLKVQILDMKDAMNDVVKLKE